jgi:hypothetical protein
MIIIIRTKNKNEAKHFANNYYIIINNVAKQAVLPVNNKLQTTLILMILMIYSIDI